MAEMFATPMCPYAQFLSIFFILVMQEISLLLESALLYNAKWLLIAMEADK